MQLDTSDPGQPFRSDSRTKASAGKVAAAQLSGPAIGEGGLPFELRALYLQEFDTLRNSIVGPITGGQAVSQATADHRGEHDAGILGGGIALLAAENLNCYVDYIAQVLSRQTSHFRSGGLGYAW